MHQQQPRNQLLLLALLPLLLQRQRQRQLLYLLQYLVPQFQCPEEDPVHQALQLLELQLQLQLQFLSILQPLHLFTHPLLHIHNHQLKL